MFDRNDPKFKELIEKGIALERLEMRLKPELGLDDRDAEIKEHDGYSDYSQEGFLGADENLPDVVQEDWEVVERYGATHGEIAEALNRAIFAEEMPNPEYKIEHLSESLGFQGCPWECKDKYNKGNGIILIYNIQKTSEEDLEAIRFASIIGYGGVNKIQENLEGEDDELLACFLESIPESRNDLTDRIAVVTEIHPHLIGRHYFFEGKHSLYRADPRLLIPALNLVKQPGK